jgi:Uma2 family endonuclease
MPQTLEPALDLPEETPGRVRWTRAQCDFFREAGVLTGRYELIDGEVISKMGQKPPHSTATGLLSDWLVEVFGAPFVRVQQTSDAGGADPEHNEPEPDVAVTRLPRRAYSGRHPGPEDVLLIAEVSDSSLRLDRTKKAALYARAGYPEYWVLDLNGRQVLVHRRPGADGYQEITAYSAEENAATLARPEASVRVGDLLP